MNEIDILNTAIHNLEKNVPLNWKWKTMDYKKDTPLKKMFFIVNSQYLLSLSMILPNF